MAVFSRYAKVLEADGTPMNVREALAAINAELDNYLADQDGGLDASSRFCVDLYRQCGYGSISFGEAEVLARAKNTSVARLADLGLVHARKGVVRLLERAELPEKPAASAPLESCLWLLAQYLVKFLESGGIPRCARLAASFEGCADATRDLAYRLYAIAGRKKWTEEAFACNALAASWPEIREQASRIRNTELEQGSL